MGNKISLRAVGLFFISAIVIVPLAAHADVYIKQKNHTESYMMMGQEQPAQDDIFVTWMSEDKARMDHGEETSVIIRLDKNLMYMINHANMEYAEMPIGGTKDIISSSIEGSDLSEEEQAQAREMMQGFAEMMKPVFSVTATGETKKIKNWNCKKYNMTMSIMGTTSNYDIWATEDIKIDYELYRNLSYSIAEQTTGMEDMMKEMNKIKGIVVLQQGSTAMMGTEVKSTQELLEVDEKSVPGSTYDIPQGYKKQN